MIGLAKTALMRHGSSYQIEDVRSAIEPIVDVPRNYARMSGDVIGRYLSSRISEPCAEVATAVDLGVASLFCRCAELAASRTPRSRGCRAADCHL
jgi:hypothetical protein